MPAFNKKVAALIDDRRALANVAAAHAVEQERALRSGLLMATKLHRHRLGIPVSLEERLDVVRGDQADVVRVWPG